MADLGEFLQWNVEGYLFKDLEAMQPISAPGTDGGGVGYPMLITTFAGIELLGGLVSGSEFNTNAGGVYFKKFWADYLYPGANAEEAGDALYQLARHGLAHGFVVKGSIAVGKDHPGWHLKRNADDVIYVDVAKLADDLIACYRTKVKPLSESSPSREKMTDWLTGMERAYAAKAESLGAARFFELAQIPPVPFTHSLGMTMQMTNPQQGATARRLGVRVDGRPVPVTMAPISSSGPLRPDIDPGGAWPSATLVRRVVTADKRHSMAVLEPQRTGKRRIKTRCGAL